MNIEGLEKDRVAIVDLESLEIKFIHSHRYTYDIEAIPTEKKYFIVFYSF